MPIPDRFDERTPVTRLSLSLVTVLSLVGCAASNETRAPRPILVEDAYVAPAGAAVTISGIELVKDTLQLRVAYSGGLEDHEFTLHASGGFMESNPVRIKVSLSHDAKGDAGEKLISEVLAFDLSPLKRAYKDMYSENGTIILHLSAPGPSDSPDHTLRYEF